MARRTIQRDWHVNNPKVGSRAAVAVRVPIPRPAQLGLISRLRRNAAEKGLGIESMMRVWVKAVLLICIGLTVASCAATTIADSIPAWAGGLPPGVPPRPGTPEYEEYRYRLTHPQAAPADDTQTRDAKSRTVN